MTRLAAAVLLLMLLGVASCGENAPIPAEQQATREPPPEPPDRPDVKPPQPTPRPIAKAKAQMANLGMAIDNYRLAKRQLPSSLDALTETSARSHNPHIEGNPYPYIDKIPLDPWGNDYEYSPLDRNTYQLQSYGADGQPDTEDDLFYPVRGR